MKKKEGMGFVAIGLGVSILVVVGLVFYLANAGNIDIGETVMMIFVAALVIGATIIVLKKMGNIKKGLPSTDELAQKNNWKAAGYSYFATIWIAVAMLWIDGPIGDMFGIEELTVVHVVAAVVLLSGMVYIGSWFYFDRRGE